MNRLFTALAVLMLTAVTAFANTATWNASTYASANGWVASTTTVENTNITVNNDISFKITQYSTKPKYYSGELRVYKTSKIVFTPANGAKLTKIVINATSSSYAGLPQSVSTGSVSKSGAVITWTGSTSSAFEMTCSASDQLRITEMTFTYTAGGGTSDGNDQFTPIYILGDMNNWTPSDAWKFSTTDGVNYTLRVNKMPAVSEFKIADPSYTLANWGGCSAIRPNIEYYLLWNEGNATMDAICANATITFNTQTRGFKVSSSKTTGGMAVPSGSAGGWPANYQGVMLQGFYWDSYEDSNWANLEYQATELSKFFKLIWLPNSGKSASNPGMGYDPVYWFTNYESAFGSEKALRSLAKKLKSKGTGLIADVVVNHRSGVSNWTDFPAEKWNGITYKLDHKHICCNDEVAGASGQPTPGGNYDTGDNFDGSRDLDHTNALVQANIKAYCQFLLEDIGYAGFRWDMVKGYGGGFIKLYNDYSAPTYSVGEYYDSSFDNVAGWIEATGRTSAAFDFPFKYAVNEAFSTGDMRKLVWTANGNKQPAGLIHNNYGRYSVTFVDNHDTYRSFDAFQGNVMAANAFMLMSPGTPCVFLPHWQQNKEAFAALIALRNSVGIHNCSHVEVLRSTADCYMAKVYGKYGDAIVKIGSAMVTPDGFNDADLKAYGNNYAVWTKVHITGAEIPRDYPSKLYLIGNVNSNNWSTSAPVAATSSGNGVYTWNSVNIEHADGSPLGYFSLVTAKGANWDVVNASHRFGAYSDSEVINGTAGVKAYPANFNAAAAKNWALAAGKYKITVDMRSMTITAEALSSGGNSAKTEYFIAPNYTTISGTKLLNADGTANGSTSNNLLNIAYKAGNVTFTSTGGGSSKAAAYGNTVRWYKSNNFQLKADAGYAISRVEAAYSASSYAGPFSASEGVVNASSNPVVWTGSASQVTLTASAQMRLNYIAVTVVPASSQGGNTETQSGGAFYEPVSNVADLHEGDRYIIVAPSVGKALGDVFSKATSGYMNAVPVTVAKDKSVYAADADGILEFTLERGSNSSSQSLSFTGSDGKTYYLAAPSTSTTLSRTSSKSTSNNVNITQGNNVANILFVKNSRRLNYGTANGGCFQAYAASSTSKLVIYRKRNSTNNVTGINTSHIANFTAPGNEEVENSIPMTNSDGSETAAGSGRNDATLYGTVFTASDSDNNELCTVENTYAKTYYPGAYGDVVRWYKNAVFTITPAEGYTITRVEAEYPSVTYAGPFTAATGEVTVDEDHQLIVWKGAASSALELTAADQIRFSSMSVTLKPTSTIESQPEQFETPDGMYVCMINDAEWQQPYAYTWSGDGSDSNAEWPGLPMTRAAEGSNTWIYSFEVETEPAFIIFNDGVVGSGQQTEDLEYVNAATYSNTEFDGIHELYLVGDFTGNWSFLDEYRFMSEDGVSYSLDIDILDKDSEFKIASKFFAPLDFGGSGELLVLNTPVYLESGSSDNNVVGQSVKDATMSFNIDTNELRLAGTDNTSTAVEKIDADADVNPIYYNLQGIRIERPESGAYIEVRGGKVIKRRL